MTGVAPSLIAVWRNVLRPMAGVMLLVILTDLLGSCRHREFLWEEPSARVPVSVEFDWSSDSTASPASMTVLLFRQGVSTPLIYDFKGHDGGRIMLMPGIYSAVCHNGDSDRHGYVGSESFENFGLRLNDNHNAGTRYGYSLAQIRSGDERIAHTPDSMWVAAIPSFNLAAGEGGILRFEMQPVVIHYTFIIHNPVNFTKAISVSATLSGMSGTVHPGLGVTGDETVTHFFEMTPTEDGGLYGEFLSFGHCGGRDLNSRDDDIGTHILVIHATLNNGRKWSSTHDVTDRIHRYAPGVDCVVRLDSLVFPPPTGSGGWSPSVGDWSGNQEEISM